jgi:hypothetical protein
MRLHTKYLTAVDNAFLSKMKVKQYLNRLRVRIVFVLGATLFAGAFMFPAAAQAAPASSMTPLTGFNYNSLSFSNQCIQDNGNGAQATLTSNRANCAVFPTPRIGYVANCTPAGGCYQYKDEAGFCLKLDPNISGEPVVFTACATSGNTKAEEEFTDPIQPSGDGVENQYAVVEDLTGAVLQGHSNGVVDLGSGSGSGYDWSI